jgi:hypothetical protein
MDKARITFDEETHRYTLDGRRVPSVTGILNDVVPGWKASEYHLALGSANHEIYRMLALGIEFDCDTECLPYVATWKQWAKENRVIVHNVDLRMASERLQYAGCCDAVVQMDGQAGLVLVDYKSAITVPVRWQLAAYSMALWECHKVRVLARLAVEVRPDGYKMEWRRGADAKRDDQEWLAILTAYRCRRAAGIKDGRNQE